MQPDRQRLATTASILLAIALTMAGTLLYALPPIAIRCAAPLYAHTGSSLVGIVFGMSILSGSVLAQLLQRFPPDRSLGFVALFLGSWATIFCQWLMEEDRRGASEFPVSLLSAWAILVLIATAAILVIKLRCSASDSANPFFCPAFLFLGCAVGAIGYSLYVERFVQLRHQVLIAIAVISCTGLVFFGAYYCLVWMNATWEPVKSPAPTWLRRLRWMLLGGLPAGVMFSLPAYVFAEIAPIPFLVYLSLTLYQITWVVAFAMQAQRRSAFAAWGVQILAYSALLPFLTLARELDRHGDDSWWLGVFLVTMIAPFLVPHRWTLTMQSSLLSIVCLQMFVKVPFSLEDAGGVAMIVLANLSACVLACLGCHSDAVADAPDADRFPEFLLFTQGGVALAGFAFFMLPLVLKSEWGIVEYPAALAACLVLRSLPWPWPRARKSPAV